MTGVRLTDLTKVYPGAAAPAVDRMSLELAPGGVTVLLGPSGCGKTTVLKMIAGLVVPTSGDIGFDGRSVLAVAPEKRKAAMVFQAPLLFPHLTVAGNVGFALKMRRVAAAEVARQVAQMLDLVRLPDVGARQPGALSGGQQQRVALARALIARPDVLLLDEPLASLDPHLRGEMRDLILTVQRQTGITTLIVTHDQQEAVVMADHVALMLGGRLKQAGMPDAFYRRPVDADVARFFGATNFVDGVVERGAFLCALGRLRLPDGGAQEGRAQEGRGCLTFRPEAVRLGAGENACAARVAARQFLGAQVRLVLVAGGQQIEAVVPPWAAEGLAKGDGVTVSLPADSLWVLPGGASCGCVARGPGAMPFGEEGGGADG